MSFSIQTLITSKLWKIWFHPLFLLVWIAIGAGLRFTHLDLKPAASIELATLIFSLGNSVEAVPVDRVIDLNTILQPLQLNPAANVTDVVHYLMTESTHPPLYFILTHWWLKLFSTPGAVVSLAVGRSLSALFGIAAIPAMFGLGWFAFRSRIIAHLAAALMAVSPYGIYLAQEARHYTLAVVFIIASLGCLVAAIRSIETCKSLSILTSLFWIFVNSFGIAIHYFFSLTLAAEGLVLCWVGLQNFRNSVDHKLSFLSPPWLRIYAVALGTLVGGLIWLPAVQGISDNEITQWIFDENPFSDLFSPIARMIAWVLTMFVMVPVEQQPLSVVIVFAIILVLYTLWTGSIFTFGIKAQLKEPAFQFSTKIFTRFVLASLILFAGLIYAVGADVSLAARYQFVYFPGVIMLAASALSIYWQQSHPNQFTEIFNKLRLRWQGKQAILMVILWGILGSLFVSYNAGFQKSRQSDLLVPLIQERSQVPVLIATVHNTHSETRELMSVALEYQRQRQNNVNPPHFLLAHKENDGEKAGEILKQAITQFPRPFDLWAVNFKAPIEITSQKCILENNSKPKVPGYKYQQYHCQ
jgi:uncharacterized membrane protein